MTDKRELILSKLLEVLQTVDGIKSVKRNLDQMPEGARPSIVLLDGDEGLPQTQSEMRSGKSPVIMHMQPVINVLVGDNDKDIGATINTIRAGIITKILTDTDLATVVDADIDRQNRKNGRISYTGMMTRFSHSFEMDCDMQVNFLIVYSLDPSAP